MNFILVLIRFTVFFRFIVGLNTNYVNEIKFWLCFPKQGQKGESQQKVQLMLTLSLMNILIVSESFKCRCQSRSEHLRVRPSINRCSLHTPGYVCLELVRVIAEHCSSIEVERVFWIGFDKKENKAHDNWVHTENRLPVFAQNVETHVTFHINVGVVNRRFQVHFGRFVRVVSLYFNSKDVLSTVPEALGLVFKVNLDIE